MFFGLPLDVNLKSQKFKKLRGFLIITELSFLKKYLWKYSPLAFLNNINNFLKREIVYRISKLLTTSSRYPSFSSILHFVKLPGSSPSTPDPPPLLALWPCKCIKGLLYPEEYYIHEKERNSYNRNHLQMGSDLCTYV